MVTLQTQSFKTIFFLVITSLLCGQMSAMDSLFEKKQKDQNERVQKPLSMDQFKQLFVPLASNSVNAFPIVFDQPQGLLIINYLFDGACVAQLFQVNERTHFESNDSKNYDFLLQSPLKTGAFTVTTQGNFTFQKPVETQTALLTCKSVKFLDKFSTKKSLTLDMNCCNNSGDVTCGDILFKGNQFNAMRKSKLTINNAATLLPAKSFFNYGMISCALNAFINTPSLENWGTLQSGILHFDGGNILNEGSININDYFLGKCKTFDHRGNMDVHNDCIFERIEKLFTARSSSWKVGGNWKAHIGHLNLEGNSTVENAALLSVDSHAILSGPFHAPILYVESEDLITCNCTAQLIAMYYVGLKAKGWMQFEGDIFKTFVQINAPASTSQKLEALLKEFPQRGIFLHSEQSGIKKSGNIVEKNGTVCLHAKKGLTHTGLTEAGFGLNSLLSMNAISLSLEKESLLKSLNAQLNAENSIDQFGSTDIKNQLAIKAPEIVLGGTSQAGNLFTQSDNLSVTVGSCTAVENCSFDAQKQITLAGKLTASEQLGMKAQDIDLEKTSHTSAKNAQLKAVETAHKQGQLNISESLITHAKYVKNSGTITAKNIQINADRLWWNQEAGIVTAEEKLTINALASTNTGGWMQANNLTINAAIDLNLLGVYRAKNTNINALIGLNAGISVPKIDSLDELITFDNALKAGECLLSTFAPTAGVVYMVGKNIVGIYQKGIDHEDGLYHKTSKLAQNAKELYAKEDSGASDWIFLVCEAKNLTTSTMQTVNTAIQVGNIAHHGYEMVSSRIKNINSPETVKTAVTGILETPSINWKDVAFKAKSSLVSTFGPHMNKDTLIDQNCGAILGVNGYSRNLYNGNSGLSTFANRNTIETRSANNSGISIASENNVHATGTYTHTGITTGINTTITAHDLNIGGTVGALHDLTLKAKDKAHIHGHSNAHNIVIQAKEATLEKDSNLNAHGGTTQIIADTITSQATIQSNVVQMKADIVKLQEGSNISTQGSNNTIIIQAAKEATLGKDSNLNAHEGTTQIIAKIITGQAAIQSNVVQMKADIVNLHDGSTISTQGSDNAIIIEAAKEATLGKGSTFNAHEGTTQIVAEIITGQATIQSNVIHMKADIVNLHDGSNMSTKGSDNTIIIEAAKEATLGKGSTFNAHEGTTQIAAEIITGQAKIQSNVVHMKADVVKLQEGSNISTQGSDNTIIIEAAKEATLGKGSTFNAHGGTTQIVAEIITNQAAIQSNVVQMKADVVKLHDGSNISTQGSDNTIIIEAAKEATLGKGSTFNAHEGTTQIAAEIITSQAAIQSNVVHMKADVVKLHDGSNISTQGSDNTIIIEAAKEATLEKGSTFNAHEGTTQIAAEIITSQAAIQSNVVQMKADIVKLQEGSNISTQGSDNTIIIEAKKSCNLNAGSAIAGGDVAIDTASLQGDTGNKITSTNQTYIKTTYLDNHGSTNGVLAIDFTGDTSQLKSIGKVDHVQYQGTLENNLADTLAQGKNELLHITKSGSVTIFAGQQDVILKDEHIMDHTLKIRTDGAASCDKTLTSNGSLDLKAGKNLTHVSLHARDEVDISAGGSVVAESTTERMSNGANYEDTLKLVSVTASKINIHADGHIVHKAVALHSGEGGTTMTAGGKIISAAVICEKHTETHHKKKRKTKKSKDDYRNPSVSNYKSEGVISMHAGDTIELEGTIFDSKGAPVLYGENGVHAYAAYDTHDHTSDYKKKGNWCSSTVKRHKQSSSAIAKPVAFKGGQTPEITSNKQIIMTCTSDSSKMILNAPLVELPLAANEKVSYSTRNASNLVWQSAKTKNKRDVTYSPSFEGEIETNAETIHSEHVKGHAPTVFKTTYDTAKISQKLLKEIHKHQTISSQGPTRAASFIIAIAVTIATSGLGASAGATMTAAVGCSSTISTAIVTNATAAAVTSLSVQAVDALLNCNGDIIAAAKTIASLDTLKNIAISATTSGVMAGAGESLTELGLPKVQDAHNLSERFMYAAPRQFTNATIKTIANVIAGQDFKDAALQNLQSASADIIGIACASEIGDAYGKDEINPITHKLLHAGVGAIEGAIRNGGSGAIAGGIGALVSETTADLLAPEKPSFDTIKEIEAHVGRPLTKEEFTLAWDDQMATYWQGVSTTADISKIAAVSVALLTHQDLDIAHTTAYTAIDNNFLVFAAYGIVGIGVIWSAYEINNAYQEGGPEAALKQLGIEVITQVACAGVGKVVGKVAFKVGSKIYLTSIAAVTAVLESKPGLKLVLGNIIEPIVAAGEKLSQSMIGKGITQVETALVNLESKAIQKFSLLKPNPMEATPKGIKTSIPNAPNETGLLQQSMEKMGKAGNEIIDSPILRNSYREANGFKFSEYYYNRLWENGRGYPGFRAESVLRGATTVVPDPKGFEGFYKYTSDGWEMIYNPTTKVVSHLSPIRKKAL